MTAEPKNAWYFNEQETHGTHCVYQLDADGGIDHSLGPFFVAGEGQARTLWMVLLGMQIMVEAKLEAESELASLREQATAREKALESCWGQSLNDDRLHFVVAVEGLPASTKTPEWVAQQVVEAINSESSLIAWRMGLPTSVRLTFALDQSSRAALSRLEAIKNQSVQQ